MSDQSRYAPARRLLEVKTYLDSTGGATLGEIADHFAVSTKTATRYLRALEDADEPLYEERRGREKVWRLSLAGRKETISVTVSQMVALFLSGRMLASLAGTGIKEDLDDVFKGLENRLRRRDRTLGRNLDRKLVDVNEAPHIYEGRLEHMNDITTALLREERLLVAVSSRQKPFLLDPYTLLVYKKGLYIAGFSHHHQGVRTFALDGLREVDWQKGNHFEYPAEYDPAKLTEGAFGMIGGALTHVRIFFDEKVARFVRRRRWHPTQMVKRVDGGVALEMDVAGTVEVVNWVLGFGDKAEVLEPASLRNQIAGELRRAANRYDGG